MAFIKKYSLIFIKIKIQKIQKAGIEPATSSVLRMRDNHYTTSAIIFNQFKTYIIDYQNLIYNNEIKST